VLKTQHVSTTYAIILKANHIY